MSLNDWRSDYDPRLGDIMKQIEEGGVFKTPLDFPVLKGDFGKGTLQDSFKNRLDELYPQGEVTEERFPIDIFGTGYDFGDRLIDPPATLPEEIETFSTPDLPQPVVTQVVGLPGPDEDRSFELMGSYEDRDEAMDLLEKFDHREIDLTLDPYAPDELGALIQDSTIAPSLSRYVQDSEEELDLDIIAEMTGTHEPPTQYANLDTFLERDSTPIDLIQVMNAVPNVQDLVNPAEPLIQDKTADVLLGEMQATFAERGKVYGSSYVRAGQVLKALIPEGVLVETEDDFAIMSSLGIVVHKLCRFLNTKGQQHPHLADILHQDSIHDIAVYSAILEELLILHNAG